MLNLKPRPWIKRVIGAPSHWLTQYRIARRIGRWHAVKVATIFTWLLVKP